MHRVMEFKGHQNPIVKFIIAGEFIFSLGEGGEFLVFNRMKGTLSKKIMFEKEFDDVIHPSTYVNKLLFSGPNEKPELWNIMTEEKVFEFDFGKENDITCFEQSPVVDIVAIGFSNGDILLVNLLYNEILLKFSQDSSRIKSLSFSSDTTLGVSLLASITESSEGGKNIVFWDLN
jgi:U3 small nucleolar RNA-associated protein 21